MKLIELELINFRQHRSFVHQFSDGITAILGPNGAGKSSLVEAIAFALYGSSVIRGKVESVKSLTASKREAVKVKLIFEHAAAIYRVERGTNDAEIFRGGEPEPIASGTRAVTARVSEILGMTYQEFLSAYYTEQKGLEFLTGQKGATERERFILRLMGYDKVELAQEVLREDRKTKRQEVAAYQAISSDRGTLVDKHEKLIASTQKASRALEQMTLALISAEETYHKYQREFQVESERKAAALTTIQKIALFESQIKDRAQSILALQSQIKKISEELVTQHDQDLATLHTEIAAAKIQLSDLEAEFNRAQGQSFSQIATLKSELDQLSQKLADAVEAQAKSELDPASTVCPTCRQEFGAGYQKYIEHLKSELAEVRGNIEQKQSALVALESAQNAHNSAFYAQKKQLDGQISRLHDLIQQEQVKQSRRQDLEQNENRFVELQAERVDLERQYSELEAGLKSSGYSADQFKAAESSFESAQSFLNVARLQRTKSEGELNVQQALLAEAKSHLDDFDLRLRKVAVYQQELDLLEVADALFSGFRKQLNAELKPRLAEVASDYLNEITEGRYVEVIINENFEPQISDHNGPLDVISGGEQDVLHLSMRLALSSLLFERSGHAFSLLILDEVFGALDENRRSNVLALLEKLGAQFEQVLLITHVDEVKDWVPNVINLDYYEEAGDQ